MSVTPAWAHASGHDTHGRWARVRVEGVEACMRWIPPGAFVMGSPADEPGRLEREGPAHPVALSRGFWMAQTPCTQALWRAVMGDNPSRYPSPERPVENVSWHDAQAFLSALGPRVPGLALPTEAQWEYACRAGSTTATHAGPIELRGLCDAPVLDAIAWYAGNSGVGFDLDQGYDSSEWPQMQHPHTRAGTRVVGLKRPNAWGLHDMLGNVWEWCADGRRRYTVEEQPTLDPVGARGTKRCSRGGCWHAAARYCRAAFRYWHHPDNRSHYLGFRFIAPASLDS